jgi:hypothetical protein
MAGALMMSANDKSALKINAGDIFITFLRLLESVAVLAEGLVN